MFPREWMGATPRFRRTRQSEGERGNTKLLAEGKKKSAAKKTGNVEVLAG